ncbi:heavy metal translocating P-type ATPase [Methanosphaerula palustris]|uniref:Heavy metal translocating P-type ATPase n=1 Tax=Methanosphaerula palustris (strain ATCC BAA-1556 / DSM 19958 / E1-9c) TaxID=521011 RepID=B8GEA6_METPE|nr:cation-translocating P-type ATPase [Methanosphaerula palustris]ACL17607.1 heavy metal translocating P-type ATPase [Methanosphaerula palustris E1-9c]
MSSCSCCSKRPARTGYRELLWEPETIFTLASGLLLAIAILIDPDMMLHETVTSGTGGLFYLIAALTGSIPIWLSALQGIWNRDFTTDIPVSLATFAAIAIGQYPAAAVVAVLLLVGGMLEAYVAARASNAMEALAALLPDQVTVRQDGGDILIPLDEVREGEIVLVRSGERIPVDGEVISGTASINQATITGESVSISRTSGDMVYAGTFNECGALEIRTGTTGDQTLLGRIRNLIVEAKDQKPPIERVLDRYSRLYTPAALLLGGLIWWWSGDILRAITMFIVFCPCVIILATPTALVASIGNAARYGNLVKTGETIEKMAAVDTVIFDKTGTLTVGKPALTAVHPLRNLTEDDVVLVAAGIEKFSEHPLAGAITVEASRRHLIVPDPESFQVLPGRGVCAVLGGASVLLGNELLMVDYGVVVDPYAADITRHCAMDSQIIAYLAINNTIAAVLMFEDSLREDAGAIVTRLKLAGLRCVMVTGDQECSASSVGRALGITEIYAQVLPQEKVAIVREMQSGGHRVAFVGDGVNDGPALAAADVGIAMGLSGTDVAIETADIALLSDDLASLPHLHLLSKKALSTIRNNLIFSVVVLVAAVVLTIPGILNPVTGALVHELSSLPVIANSVRLIVYRVR